MPRQRLLAAAAVAVLVLAGLLIVVLGSGGGRAHRSANTRAASTATAKQPKTPRTSTQSSRPATTPTRRLAPSPPMTVPGAAGALTTVVTQDLRSGGIDQHGQDLLNHLQGLLQSYEQGHANDALHKLDDLSKHVSDLAAHGDIRAAELPPITAAISNLRVAMLRQPASTANKP